MMRVLFFELTDTIGGIESFLLNIVRNLKWNNNVQFDFVTTVDNPAYYNLFKNAGIHFIKVSEKSNLVKYYIDLQKLFSERKYSMIHIQKNSLSDSLPIYFAQKYGVPYIIHAQNSAPSRSNLAVNALHYINRMLFIKKNAVKLACGSEAANWMFGSLDDVQIIKNGINPEEFMLNNTFRNHVRKQYHADNDLVICNVGRFADQKNHTFLIEIFNEIHKINRCSKLFLVGDGSNFEAIKKRVGELGIDNSVVFFGSLERSLESKVLMASDIYLMPSLYEGVSIASVEAQMAGLYLFASDTVDKDTNITGNVTFLSLQKQPKEWAETILNKVAYNKKVYDYESLLLKIRDAGYDMEYTTRLLMEMYITMGKHI